MSKYLNKEAVLDWLADQYFNGMGEEPWNTAISKLKEKIESGAFDTSEPDHPTCDLEENEQTDDDGMVKIFFKCQSCGTEYDPETIPHQHGYKCYCGGYIISPSGKIIGRWKMGKNSSGSGSA